MATVEERKELIQEVLEAYPEKAKKPGKAPQCHRSRRL
jgi:hypothetical protein